MLRIEIDPKEADRWDGADFGLFCQMEDHACRANDVRTYCSDPSCNSPNPTLELPTWLEARIRETLEPDVRALIGNAGCELTYRHVHGADADKNAAAMLAWAEWAYSLVGERLVLGPMDFDIIHDVMTGARLLRWAGARGVPLAVFCGYRLLFPANAFDELARVDKLYPFADFGIRDQYPFDQVSDAIKASGAEVWTGAGFADGLRQGVIERAGASGLSGVMTGKGAWIDGLRG